MVSMLTSRKIKANTIKLLLRMNNQRVVKSLRIRAIRLLFRRINSKSGVRQRVSSLTCRSLKEINLFPMLALLLSIQMIKIKMVVHCNALASLAWTSQSLLLENQQKSLWTMLCLGLENSLAFNLISLHLGSKKKRSVAASPRKIT